MNLTADLVPVQAQGKIYKGIQFPVQFNTRENLVCESQVQSQV